MYTVVTYGPNNYVRREAEGCSIEGAWAIVARCLPVNPDYHTAIIGDSGRVAEYWRTIDGTPVKFDARWNHKAYRDMKNAA